VLNKVNIYIQIYYFVASQRHGAFDQRFGWISTESSLCMRQVKLIYWIRLLTVNVSDDCANTVTVRLSFTLCLILEGKQRIRKLILPVTMVLNIYLYILINTLCLGSAGVTACVFIPSLSEL